MEDKEVKEVEVVDIFKNRECGIFEKEIEKTNQIIEKLKMFDDRDLEITGFHKKFDRSKIDARVKALERCRELNEKYKVVHCDREAKRKTKHSVKNNGYETGEKVTLEIPLIFDVKIPATKLVKIEARSKDHTAYNVIAEVPPPPLEALKTLGNVPKNEFDEIHLWWVPNELFISKIEKPDPIIVGVKKVPLLYNVCDYDKNAAQETHYFEIYRWIDERYENAYWAREGY